MVAVLYTSDVHCAFENGIGYAGVQAIRDSFEDQGYTTILVDNGDAMQGTPYGTISEGEIAINLMNDLRYDVATIGNHEFDYGMVRLFELIDKADFPYCCCNFTESGELALPPYVIVEREGIKIAFVGISTPWTITAASRPCFMDTTGEFIYGLCEDETGDSLYEAVQNAVDSARADGADYVIALSHLGNQESDGPWRYSEVVRHTNGIDLVLDGHSHDLNTETATNKDGVEIVRLTCGKDLEAIGYSIISPIRIIESDIIKWNNKISMPSALGIDNDMVSRIHEEEAVYDDQLNEVIGHTDYQLCLHDPEYYSSFGNPPRLIRKSDTNLGDLITDSILYQSGADVAIMTANNVSIDFEQGDITMLDLMRQFQYDNNLCVIEVSGQNILEALEYGTVRLPQEAGYLLQVAGMSYEVDTSVPSGVVTDSKGEFSNYEGEHRVKNVLIGGEPLDLNRNYRLAGSEFLVHYYGYGFNMFRGAAMISADYSSECQAFKNYIQSLPDQTLGDEYSNPRGQGRIVVR